MKQFTSLTRNAEEGGDGGEGEGEGRRKRRPRFVKFSFLLPRGEGSRDRNGGRVDPETTPHTLSFGISANCVISDVRRRHLAAVQGSNSVSYEEFTMFVKKVIANIR